MANFTHVQGAVATEGSALLTLSIVLGSNPTAGNLVCVAVVASVAVTNMQIIDAAGNAYTRTPSSPSTFQTGAGQVWLFWMAKAPSNASKTLVVTWTTGSNMAGWADEFSYTGGSCIFDKDAAANTGTAGTTINTPSLTPTNSASLLYAGAAAGGTISAPAAGGTLGVWTGSGGAITNGDMAEYDLSASAGTAVQFTQSSGGWSAMSMAFFTRTPGHIQLEGGTGNVELENLTGDIQQE